MQVNQPPSGGLHPRRADLVIQIDGRICGLLLFLHGHLAGLKNGEWRVLPAAVLSGILFPGSD